MLKKTKINPQKTLSIILAVANSLNSAAPIALPLAAIVPEMPKARQGAIDELLATSFNRGGQLLDRLFFSTAYAGDNINAGDTKNVDGTNIPNPADGDVINSGGVQNVYDTGSATNTIISSGGRQNVSNGGSTSGTDIRFGGRQHVSSGGSAQDTAVSSGGQQHVSNGGAATDTVIHSGGNQYVYNGGTASGTIVNSNAQQNVLSGGTASDTTVNNNGTQNVMSGGSVSGGSVNGSYAQQWLLGGTATSVTVANGGQQHVSSGGTASGTIINSGGMQNVSSGGSAANTVINSSGTQLVYDGGAAAGTFVNAHGAQIINSGGTASGSIISGANAHQMLYGNSISATVHSGGYQSVQAAGVATGTELYGTGFQEVYGTANSTYINGGAQYIYTNGIANSTEIYGNGHQYVSSGGQANGTAIYTGFQDVLDGGRASGTTIHDGNQTVSGGGQAFHTTISGGTQEVKTNARAYNTTISGGNQALSGSNSLAENTVIHNGGTQEVGSIAVAHRTTISAGGRQIFNEGFARNTTIAQGGIQELDQGMADLTTIQDGSIQNISVGGTATNTTIMSGGVQNVYAGGTAGGTTEISSDVTLDNGSLFLASGTLFSGGTAISGGTQNVLGGSALGTIIYNGGTQAVSSGSAVNTIIHSGGTQSVYRGVNVSGSTVNAGGMINLVQSGAALQGDTTLNQGTIQIFNPATGSYEISRLVVNGGGTVKLAAGTIGNHLTLDDLQGAASFIINTDLANNTSDQIEIKSSTNAAGSTIQVAFDPGFASGSSISGTAVFANVDTGDTSFQTLPTDWGAYRFTPTVSASTDPSGTTWSITGLSTSGSTPGGNPGVSETMLTASDVITNNLTLWRTENNSLMRRMGELRNDPGKAGEWIRFYRGETEADNPGSRHTKATYTAIQGGYDKKHGNYKGGTLYTGYTAGYLDASIGFNRGGGDASSLTVGAYGSWLGDKGHFLDVIAKQGRLKNSYHNYLLNPGNTKVTGSYHNWGTSLSVEYGFRQAQKDGWYLEPQAEISFGRVSSADYTASDSTRVHNSSLNSTVGRLGLAIGKTTPAGSFYAKASIAREFSARSKITMSTGGLAPVTLDQDLKESWLEFALGLTGAVGKNTNGYLEISKTTGDTVKTPWQVNAGLRLSF
ncbi:autotransporter outer membrane beta-barrel domain-containing protein [Sporomusa sphaeroides DSM 2875]|uniref:autotransporter outer membrane beta-barrel domain-containing protein n=1 Tax=Sporomusa sphaeroides TaxID=47679 RepID=UPI00202E011B|nr:autotransporter outer membrane beta-barrel domain-containing protein [Sporomusa sphaeroides]MCM0758671.1 autotransporter outer membrane beta-barrel domain-containing protein [Sporomusa sphaeroides DSM 2875]